MKKLLLSLGAIASVAAPVAAVVACGSTTPDATFKEVDAKYQAPVVALANAMKTADFNLTGEEMTKAEAKSNQYRLTFGEDTESQTRITVDVKLGTFISKETKTDADGEFIVNPNPSSADAIAAAAKTAGEAIAAIDAAPTATNVVVNPASALFDAYDAKINTDLATHAMSNITSEVKAAILGLEVFKEDKGAVVDSALNFVRNDHTRYFFKASSDAAINALLSGLLGDEAASAKSLLKSEYGLTDQQVTDAKFYIDVFTGTLEGSKVNNALNFRHDTTHHANVHAVFGELTATGARGLVAFQEDDATPTT